MCPEERRPVQICVKKLPCRVKEIPAPWTWPSVIVPSSPDAVPAKPPLNWSGDIEVSMNSPCQCPLGQSAVHRQRPFTEASDASDPLLPLARERRVAASSSPAADFPCLPIVPPVLPAWARTVGMPAPVPVSSATAATAATNAAPPAIAPQVASKRLSVSISCSNYFSPVIAHDAAIGTYGDHKRARTARACRGSTLPHRDAPRLQFRRPHVNRPWCTRCATLFACVFPGLPLSPRCGPRTSRRAASARVAQAGRPSNRAALDSLFPCRLHNFFLRCGRIATAESEILR
jgi:hypothetical protein